MRRYYQQGIFIVERGVSYLVHVVNKITAVLINMCGTLRPVLTVMDVLIQKNSERVAILMTSHILDRVCANR